ncbi:MAG: hypothetical protein ABFD94_12350 [Armatimonadia bacterium]
MTQAPLRPDLPDPGTDEFAPVAAPARLPSLPRFPLLIFALVGVVAGVLLGLQYSNRPPGDTAPNVPLAGQLLRMALPPQDEAGILFSSNDVKPTANPDLLPAGLSAVYAFYEAPGRRSADQPQVKWTRDGKPLPPPPAGDVRADPGGSSGKILLRPPGGKLVPGVYEVELKLGVSNLAASFVAAWGAEQIASQAAPADAQVTVSDLALATAVSAQHLAQRPQKSFDGRERIFAAFRFAQAEPGSAIVVKWYGGTEPIKAATKEIVLPSTAGTASAWLQAHPASPLPTGEYSVTVSMAGDATALATGTFSVVEPSPLGAANKKGGARGSALCR